MTIGSSKAPRPLPLPAWAEVQDLVALDRLQFHQMHKKLYAHRQRVEEARGYYNVEETERQSDAMTARAEAMRRSRRRHQEEASLDMKKENQRLVERLCLVMRESEQRQRHMMVPKPPSTAPAATGTLNFHTRRKAAQRIDKDNRALLDRIIRTGPSIVTRDELKVRYQEHHQFVKNHTRIKRSWNKTDITSGPPARHMQLSESRPQRRMSGQQAARARDLAPLPEAKRAPSNASPSTNGEIGAPTAPKEPPSRGSRPVAGQRSKSETKTALPRDMEEERQPEEVQLAKEVARSEVQRILSVAEQLASEAKMDLDPASEDLARQSPRSVEEPVATQREESEDEYGEDDYEAEDNYGDDVFEDDDDDDGDVASPKSKTTRSQSDLQDDEDQSPQASPLAQKSLADDEEDEFSEDEFELGTPQQATTGRVAPGLEDREEEDLLDWPEVSASEASPKVGIGLGRTSSEMSDDYESFERDESSMTGNSQRVPPGQLRSTDELIEDGDLGRPDMMGRRSPGTYDDDDWFEEDSGESLRAPG
eukprot:CAMPEP_0197664698 /NCGR_PEP_ID=MMETSP1338-20131121/58795_1 /TAXON_ID=43686 ORGANISM="Pelagodinium beii, Strain RCC1491" /NCGR_SAMPLE_ID=MMETSP1338 /ASSEMBLY_ACC=CAM_ASM_000754 /LENGTH=535 /DNA_ID=CAMNT_0043243393 /DNA_START=16 /DNA_END=1623 /DNA_ORIENTATION=-